MNAFKRFIHSKGIKLESDFPFLPFDIKGKFGEPGHIFLDGVSVNSEKATVTEYTNVMNVTYCIQRNGKIECLYD